MESCPTYFGVEDAELKELADALKILHVYCDNKEWNEDDFISVFEELTGLCFLSNLHILCLCVVSLITQASGLQIRVLVRHFTWTTLPALVIQLPRVNAPSEPGKIRS